MEALARLRKEESLRIFQRQVFGKFGIGDDVTVAQLGQDHFQRLAEAIEHTNAILQRNNRSGRRSRLRALINGERKTGLRIRRMDQEGSAAVHIAPQQPQTLVSGIPGLHHNVVEFVAQEVFHYVLVAVVDFE